MNKRDDESIWSIIGIVGFVILMLWGALSSSGTSASDTNSSDYQRDSSYEETPGSGTPSTSSAEEYYESHGYDCTDDCSGHDAGYEWADENGICDEYYEDGNSDSFNEGVQTYAQDNC